MKAQTNTATSSSLPKSWAIVLLIAIASIPFWGTGCGESGNTDGEAKGYVTTVIQRVEYAAEKPLKVIHPPQIEVGGRVTILDQKEAAVNFLKGGASAVNINLVADEPLKSGDEVKAILYKQTQAYHPGGRSFETIIRVGIVKIRPEHEAIFKALKDKAENPAKVAEAEKKTEEK